MIGPLRPSVRMLSDALAGRILDEAFDVLAHTGVLVENSRAASLLYEHGAARSPSGRVLLPRGLVESSLATAPATVRMYDCSGDRSFVVGGEEVHFDPGSAALRLFDHQTQSEREARTSDVIDFVRLTDRLAHFHFQSTGLISSDVPEEVADAYRLYLSLVWGSKPLVTGIFVVDGFAPMSAMLAAVRGGSDALRKKPLAIFDACPSPPLTWTTLTAQSLIDCARAGIPSELVAMPLTGATAPATIAGALVQLTAENLSGLAIAQSASPGAPVIFGGSPASFDMRTGNAPMGAIETMMIDVAYTQIGKALRLPTFRERSHGAGPGGALPGQVPLRLHRARGRLVDPAQLAFRQGQAGLGLEQGRLGLQQAGALHPCQGLAGRDRFPQGDQEDGQGSVLGRADHVGLANRDRDLGRVAAAHDPVGGLGGGQLDAEGGLLLRGQGQGVARGGMAKACGKGQQGGEDGGAQVGQWGAVHAVSWLIR